MYSTKLMELYFFHWSSFTGPVGLILLKGQPYLSTDVCCVQDLEDGGAVDFYHAGQLVCWTDQGREMIACHPTNRSDSSHVKVTNTLIIIIEIVEQKKTAAK